MVVNFYFHIYRVITKLTQEFKTGNTPEPYYHKGFKYMYSIWRYCMTKEPEDFAKWLTNNKGKANGVCEFFKKVSKYVCFVIPEIFKRV